MVVDRARFGSILRSYSNVIRDFLSEALWLSCWLTIVPLAAASVSGLVVALFQAVTQIQEQTTVYVVKLAAISLAIALLATTIAERFHALMMRFGALVVSGGGGTW